MPFYSSNTTALAAPELVGPLLVDGVDVSLVQQEDEHQVVTKHGQPATTVSGWWGQHDKSSDGDLCSVDCCLPSNASDRPQETYPPGVSHGVQRVLLFWRMLSCAAAPVQGGHLDDEGAQVVDDGVEELVGHLPPRQVRHALQLVVQVQLRGQQAFVKVSQEVQAERTGAHANAWEYCQCETAGVSSKSEGPHIRADSPLSCLCVMCLPDT